MSIPTHAPTVSKGADDAWTRLCTATVDMEFQITRAGMPRMDSDWVLLIV